MPLFSESPDVLYNMSYTMKIQDIADIYHVAPSTILNKIKSKYCYKNRGTRKYTFNNDYFEIIDTEDKAYWLGYFYADGCVHKRKCGSKIECSISSNDIEHLEKFKKSIQLNSPVFVRRKCGCISICSRKIGLDLIKLGCVPNKSLILKFPTEEQVPLNLCRHFIRGYYDGDGGISIKKVKQIYFIGTYELLNSINLFFTNQLNIPLRNVHRKYPSKIYKLQYFSQIKIVLDFLYKDCNIYLDRKFQKYQLYNQYIG